MAERGKVLEGKGAGGERCWRGRFKKGKVLQDREIAAIWKYDAHQEKDNSGRVIYKDGCRVLYIFNNIVLRIL
jgi:hypothetical protein